MPEDYDYALPPELIATTPSQPRDQARLLIYDRQQNKISFDRFAQLENYLPAGSELVFNETKVLPARLTVHKTTGGRVELLRLTPPRADIWVLADRRLAIDEKLYHQGQSLLRVAERENERYRLDPLVKPETLEQIFETHGQTPLPPYLKHSPLSETARRQEYQSVLAKVPGSVAAPTASLHFTPELLSRLTKAGHALNKLTLHVGLGTFAPLRAEQLASGKLHTEHYHLSSATADHLTAAHRAQRPIIAVGTTVARALESAWENNALLAGDRQTNIFIKPPYQWHIVTGLITNFHVPRSSLMMLVASLVGREKLLEIYQRAIDEKMRFYSFGDGMLII